MKQRIYFLDNLRTILVFLVVLLHSGMTYEAGFDSFWIVSDPDKCTQIALVRMYIDLFVMFIMFFISGYFIPASIENKKALDFLKSKFNRILFPWIIAVFTLIPAYKALFLLSRNLPQEEWFSYFHIYQRSGADLSYFANNPSQSWLWFLPMLFLFQVAYLILSKTPLLSVKMSLKTAVISTVVIGFISSMIISNMGLKGWTHSPVLDFQRERLLVYFLVFLLGSLCYRLQIFDSDIKNKKAYIISNVVLTASLTVYTIVAINLFYNIVDPARNHFFISEQIDKACYYLTLLLAMLSFLHIFIHSFRFSFNKTNKLMDHLNRNSYYVYIIHMIVLGVIAFILVPVPLPAVVKYLILALATFVISHSLIYGFRRVVYIPASGKTVIPVLLVVSLLTAAVYIFQANEQPSDCHANSSPPAMSLHEAALTGDLDIVKQHIAAGSDLDVMDPAAGTSPLFTASAFGAVEIAIALIDAGADVNYIAHDGTTPLHAAAFFCRTEIVEALLENGADKSIRSHDQRTPFDVVSISFDEAKAGYDYFSTALGPLGLKLDYARIKATRPRIAEMLR